MRSPLAFLLLALIVVVSASVNWDGEFTELAKLIKMNAFRMEEKVRTDGSSGLKQQRGHVVGSEAWYQPSHTSYTIMAIHDHPDYQGMIGMGEIAAVLNGVEFETRHNDYYLMEKGKNKGDPLRDIKLPPVPPSVLEQPTVEAQIKEMKEYFKAFHTQDRTHRDYTPYFRAALCYLEGAWSTQTEGIQEAFPSDRHLFDSTSWEDMLNKVQYNSYTGRKNRLENFSFLPKTIYGIDENGKPKYAQWTYSIMCHRLKSSLPLDRFKREDDLQARYVNRKTFDEFAQTRGARYRLERDSDGDRARVTYLDYLMYEIPGKDGYNAVINETSLGDTYTSLFNDKELLNVARYNRVYGSLKPDALGRQDTKRGFSDAFLFEADNTQEDIVPMSINICEKDNTCYNNTKRVSYAIPLEIIYLTPLLSWNPYNIPEITELKNLKKVDGVYNGWHKQKFYRTPVEFFSGGDNSDGDPADTGADPVKVMDGNGVPRDVVPSGVYIFMPNIEGVGRLRIRYPIPPIHGEGSATWKEINALKEIVMQMKSNKRFLREDFFGSMVGNQDSALLLQTYIDRNKMLRGGGDHFHVVTVSMDQRAHMRASPENTVRFNTTCFRFESLNHNHDIEVQFTENNRFVIKAVYVDGVAKDPTLNTTWHHNTKIYLRTFARTKYNGEIIYAEQPTA